MLPGILMPAAKGASKLPVPLPEPPSKELPALTLRAAAGACPPRAKSSRPASCARLRFSRAHGPRRDMKLRAASALSPRSLLRAESELSSAASGKELSEQRGAQVVAKLGVSVLPR